VGSAAFSVQLARPAAGDLDKLAKSRRQEILDDIGRLRDDPFPKRPTKRKLKGFKAPYYRLRCGEFRVLYRIDGPVVTIMRVINRNELERIIKSLK
jgi:mRNA-degrading endonuclease RelE of RelBE toxin-antitoxin system